MVENFMGHLATGARFSQENRKVDFHVDRMVDAPPEAYEIKLVSVGASTSDPELHIARKI
jgi:hypothetical protein